MARLVVIRATAEVRSICPDEFIEGRWMRLPDEAETIAIATPPGARPLMVRPSGKWERNESGETAAVWEVTWDDFEVEV